MSDELRLDKRALGRLWAEILRADAGESARNRAIWSTGRSRASEYLGPVRDCLDSSSDDVRRAAMLVLVFDFGQRDAGLIDRAWAALDSEERDPGLRTAAASCLSSIYGGSMNREVFSRFRALLERESDGERVGLRVVLYEALFKVAGRTKSEWPLLRMLTAGDPLREVNSVEVDWDEVRALERELD